MASKIKLFLASHEVHQEQDTQTNKYLLNRHNFLLENCSSLQVLLLEKSEVKNIIISSYQIYIVDFMRKSAPSRKLSICKIRGKL